MGCESTSVLHLQTQWFVVSVLGAAEMLIEPPVSGEEEFGPVGQRKEVVATSIDLETDYARWNRSGA